MKKTVTRFLCVFAALCLLFTSTSVLAKSSTSTTEQAGKIKGIQATKPTATDTQTNPDYYSMVDNPAIACSFYNPTTLREVEDLSDVIIRATFLEVAKQENIRDSSNTSFYSFIHSKIRVDEVYAGNVKPGDILDLFEPYHIETVDGKQILTHYGQYYPCEMNREYMFFLDETPGKDFDSRYGLSPEQNYYGLAWGERGRFPIVNAKSRSAADIANMTNRQLNLSPKADTTVYKSIYNEVIDKYMMDTVAPPDYDSMTDSPIPASYAINPATLKELEENTDVIVEGTFLKVVQRIDGYSDLGKYLYSYTRSAVKVNKVYSGNLQAGDVITLSEPYYPEYVDGRWVLAHHMCYYPSQIGKSYIWFLDDTGKKQPDPVYGPYYSPVLCERGRYPVANADACSPAAVESMSNRELDLSPNGSSKVFKSIYNEVINKYMKN